MRMMKMTMKQRTERVEDLWLEEYQRMRRSSPSLGSCEGQYQSSHLLGQLMWDLRWSGRGFDAEHSKRAEREGWKRRVIRG
jgi:hypothetical protein